MRAPKPSAAAAARTAEARAKILRSPMWGVDDVALFFGLSYQGVGRLMRKHPECECIRGVGRRFWRGSQIRAAFGLDGELDEADRKNLLVLPEASVAPPEVRPAPASEAPRAERAALVDMAARRAWTNPSGRSRRDLFPAVLEAAGL